MKMRLPDLFYCSIKTAAGHPVAILFKKLPSGLNIQNVKAIVD